MNPRRDERIPLQDVINALINNNSTMKRLDFASILMNPSLRVDVDGDAHTVSNMGDEELLRLAEAIMQNTTLEIVTLWGVDDSRYFLSRWTQIGSEAIGNALKNHPTLKLVYLSMKIYRIEDKASRFGFLKCLTGNAKIETLHINLSTSLPVQNPNDRFASLRWRNIPEVLNEIGENLLESENHGLKQIYIEGTSFGYASSRDDYISSAPVALTSFATALALHKSLETIDFIYLPLGDAGTNEITQALLGKTDVPESKNETLLKLTEIKFHVCSIRDAVDGVIAVAISSPNLSNLGLANNHLREDAAIKIIDSLPKLPKLTCLKLDNIRMSKRVLSHLVDTYMQYNLKIVELSLGSNPVAVMDPSMELLQKLIRGNEHLKILKLHFSDLNGQQFEMISPTLMDPNQCQLERLSLGVNQPFSLKNYNRCINILYNNEYLCNLSLPRYSAELLVACDINVQKKYLRAWDSFINIALIFFNWCFSRNKNDRCKLPIDAITLLLLFLGPRTPRARIESVDLCIDLVKTNMEERVRLIECNEYNPETDLVKDDKNGNKQIITSKWWSHTLAEEQPTKEQKEKSQTQEEKKSTPRLLFLARDIITPNLMKLPDITDTLRPYLSSAQSEISQDGTKNILIDLSNLPPGRQKYIQDVFFRLFRLMLDRHYHAIPENNLDENGTLRIKGIGLNAIKRTITEANEPVVAENTCTCSLFLKMLSSIAIVSGILLLALLHTPIGLAVGVTSLFAGGLTLFLAGRERKHEAATMTAHLVVPQLN